MSAAACLVLVLVLVVSFLLSPFLVLCCLSIPYLLSCQGRRLLVFDALMRSDHCQAPAVRGSGWDQDQDIKDQGSDRRPSRRGKGKDRADASGISGAHGAVLGRARLRRRGFGLCQCFVIASCRPGARPGGRNAQQRLGPSFHGCL